MRTYKTKWQRRQAYPKIPVPEAELPKDLDSKSPEELKMMVVWYAVELNRLKELERLRFKAQNQIYEAERKQMTKGFPDG